MPLLLSTLRRRVSCRWVCRACERQYASSSSSPSLPVARSGGKATIDSRLPGGPARTRFAPSPTGYLHLGSLRTALFNYLLAKATGGQFLLRIEDTDQKRTIPDSEDRLCQDLEWAGLQWDEGPKVGGPYGPYKQSQRTALYREHAEQLLLSGHAYRCFCTPQRLLALAKHRSELGLPTDYDRACVHVSVEEAEDRASKGEAHVIRLKVPPKYPEFRDLVYGLIPNRPDKSAKAIMHPAFDDPILLKSDGFPTYHLANVVDDHYMKITHVVRGTEWMSSTHKHLALYDAFGWESPAFAHVGLLLDKERHKLSKRNLDLDISAFREKMGIFPETITNFVALLGWSHGQRKDIMSLQELVDNFSMKFTRGDTVVTFEKLWFLQRAHAGRYIEAGDASKISMMKESVTAALDCKDPAPSFNPVLTDLDVPSYIDKLLHADGRNYTNGSAFLERNKYFFTSPTAEELAATRPNLRLRQVPLGIPFHINLEEITSAITYLTFIPAEQWKIETIKTCIASIIATKTDEMVEDFEEPTKNFDGKTTQLSKAWSKVIHQYLRWAIVAGMPGPDGAESLELLGRDQTVERLERAAEVILSGKNNVAEKVDYKIV